LSTEEIVKLLLEAVEQINLIREQWARMIQFFSKLAAQAYSTQQVTNKIFHLLIFFFLLLLFLDCCKRFC